MRRLVQRDRKEMLGNAVDILDKYTTEFGDGAADAAADAPAAAAAAPSSSTSAAAAPAAAAAASSSPFAAGPGAAGAASPFAAGPGAAAASPFAAGPGAAAASPFGGPVARPSRLASIEPKGLSPDMGPDPIVAPPKDTRSWLQRITLTQVVLFFSFSTIIATMIATFFVVVNTGAVRLAGIE